MGNKRVDTNNKIDGRIMVDIEKLETPDAFIEARLLNVPSTIRDMSKLTVGKAALKDQGGYLQPEGRADKERVEMYLPLVYKAVAVLMRPDDEWDERFAEGCLALCEADKRSKSGNNNGVAAYAKTYIMGYIKNFQNPSRQGLMNMVEMHEEHVNIAGEDNRVSKGRDATRTTLESTDQGTA